MPIIGLRTARPGMVVGVAIDDPVTGRLLVKEGTKLTEKIIDGLIRKQIDEVDVLDRYTLSIDPNDSMREELRRELNQITHRYAPSYTEGNKSDAMTRVSKIVSSVINRIIEDDKYVHYCTQMKIISKPLLRHSYTVSVLGMLLAGALELSPGDIFTVGRAGLLHDIGMLEMPHLIFPQDRKTEQDLALHREHAAYGYHLAGENGIDDEVASLIYAHHENDNGSGYPLGLTRGNIPMGSRILSVCDTFDGRSRFDGQKVYQAIEYLYGGGGYYFDPDVSNCFLKSISIYPLGSLVRLSTGETGVVVNVRRNYGDRPVVSIWYNKSDRRYSHPRLVDLGVELTMFITEML